MYNICVNTAIFENNFDINRCMTIDVYHISSSGALAVSVFRVFKQAFVSMENKHTRNSHMYMIALQMNLPG